MDESTLSTNYIERTVTYVKQELINAEGGHDWWHIHRVWQLARHIGAKEQVDMLVVELGALLHDIADSKFHNGDESIGPQKAGNFLQSIGTPEPVTRHVVNIIQHISFKGGNHRQEFFFARAGCCPGCRPPGCPRRYRYCPYLQLRRL